MSKILERLNEEIKGNVTLEKATLPNGLKGSIIIVDEIYKTNIFLSENMINDYEKSENKEEMESTIYIISDEVNSELSKNERII